MSNLDLEWLNELKRFGMKFGLDRIRFILEKLDNPQDEYGIIHVGGTNGKGSVCQFLGNILKESGYKVGIYTSPHIQNFSERIAVDGREISENDLSRLISRLKKIIDKFRIEATFFELSTAIAFLYFMKKRVDFAIIEVGLGGKLDATNVVNPIVSVITNISREHTNILGNTIEEIALDKSCIIKSAAVTAATGKGLKILKEVCKSRKIPLKIVGEDVKWERIGQRKFLVKAKRNYEVVTAMNGKYQGENIALAIAAIESLSNYGIDLRKESIIEGISMTKLPGRLEILERKPRILLDGAHNPAAFLALREFLEKDIDYDQLILVMGILKDKDIRSMVGIIAPLADHIILTKVRNERACDPKIIAREIKTIEPNEPKMIIEPTVERAINFARSISRADDLICVCGSLYLVGEARDYLMNILS